MSEYNTKIINRLCVEFYNNLSGDSNELSLLEGLRQFDFEAFLDEQQERSKKGLQPSSVLRLLMWNMVDYLVKSYSTWGEKKETADITGDLIEIFSDTIVKGYISSYGDNEFYINALGQVRKRESAVPEANKPQRNKTIPTETDIEKLSLPEELNTAEAKDLFSRVRWCKKDGGLYKWIGTAALFGYFTDKTSDYLRIRPSNDRVPWSKYKKAFQMNTKDIDTARQAVNGYKNQQKNEPEGFLEIKKICEK